MGCEIAEKEGHHINMYTCNLNNIFVRKKIFEKNKDFLITTFSNIQKRKWERERNKLVGNEMKRNKEKSS